MLSNLSLPACNWVFLANTVVTDEIYLFTGEFPIGMVWGNSWFAGKISGILLCSIRVIVLYHLI
jgi:hypothetical protein